MIKLLTKELKLLLAVELVKVRKDNDGEGSELFQSIMGMLEEVDYEADFNDVIKMAKLLEEQEEANE